MPDFPDKPIETSPETTQDILADLPSGLEWTGYNLHFNNRIFSRDMPTYGLPGISHSPMYDFGVTDISPIKSNTKSITSRDEYLSSYTDIFTKIFSNYPNSKIPEERLEDLAIEPSVINLLDANRDFSDAIMLVLNNEGGYGEDNRGGKTKFGISQVYNTDLDVPNITINDAIRRYYSSYWTQNNTLKNILYKPLQMSHFDDTVLAGIGGANQIMRNFLFETFDTDDFDDGISLMNSYLQTASREQAIQLYDNYSNYRLKYYQERDKADKYQNGWRNRIDNTTKFINNNYMDSWEL